LRRTYLAGAAATVLASASVFGALAVWSGPVVTALLGESWSVGGLVLRWLALGAILQSITYQLESLLVAARAEAWVSRLAIAQTALGVAGFTLGAQVGIEYVAASVAVTQFIMLFPRWWISRSYLD